jgi:O-antigen/teichoic acid export membrane protein
METDRGVYHRSIQGGKWYMLNTAAQKVLQLVTFFVLARLLLPQDYGIITIGDALLQRKEEVESFLNTVWTFELLRSIVLAAVLFVLGPVFGSFFNIPQTYTSLFFLSGILLIVAAFSNVRQVYFFRDLDLKKVFIRDFACQILYTAAAIGYAVFVQASAWALFTGMAAQYAMGVVMSYLLRPNKPGCSFRFGRLRSLWRFSKWVYGQDILELILAQIDKVLVGKLLTVTDVGLYSKAQSVAGTGTSLVASLVSKVGFPAFSKIQDRLDKVREGFVKSIDILLMSSMPISLLLLLEGGSVVFVLLGSNWLMLVVPLKIFAFGNLFVGFVRITNPVLAAMGRPDINFKTNILQSVLSVPLMYAGIRFYGVNGLASTMVILWFVLLSYVVLRARSVLKINRRLLYPEIVSGAIAVAAAFLSDVALRAATGPSAPIVGLGRAGCVGLVYFGALIFITGRMGDGPWRTFASILRELHIIRR